MAEEVSIEEIVKNDFFGFAVLSLMASLGLDKFNGIETPFRPLLQRLEEERERIVNELAGQKILEAFKERTGAIQDLLYDAERALKSELKEKGLLRDEG